ncbi:MAG: aminopeptidase P family N-terminal domain-containing protein [Spirochaetes bacterium]|nr:aminopeptidase P family N-terminal domain-containing protein [Spirochaetota bacterium]
MFIKEEIQEKQKRIRTFMEDRKFTAVYLKRQANFSWLTGGEISYVNIATDLGGVGLLITPEKAYAVSNNIEAVRMEKEAELPAQGYEIRSYPWHNERETAIVKELGGTHIAADFGFPGAMDVSGEIARLRYSLTPWEVERIRDLARRSSLAAEETLQQLKRGEKECQVIGRLSQKLWENRIDFVIAFCAADERIFLYRHPITTERRIETRAMLSVNTRKGGLIVSITRFAQLGKVPQALRKQYQDNVYIDSVIMAATMPGRPVLDAFKAGIEAYKQLGYPNEWELHHQGGAIGYMPRDYRVTWQTSEIVQENQAFTWNPSISGTKSEDTMLATSKGPVVLSEPVVYPVLQMEVGGYTFKRPDILEL